MKTAPLPDNEVLRVLALERLGLIDTPPDAVYDNLAQAAASLCEVPIALICLIDPTRQWFKSCVGLDISETSRGVAFCAHTILQPNTLMEIEDATLDDRFHDNPLVSGDPEIRFYAGQPLVTSEGYALGTLCVIDRKARKLTASQRDALANLAEAISILFEERRSKTISAISDVMEKTDGNGIVISDATQADYPISYCNHGFETLTGYSREEILGKNCRFLQGEDTDPAAVMLVREAIADHRDISVVLKNYRKDGTAFWNELSISPVKDSDDVVTHLLGIQKDVTELRMAEAKTRKLREELTHVARVNTLGQLGTNIAHELNQPLVAIAQNVDAALTTLKQSKSADPELLEILADIEGQSQRAGRIIKATRQFVSKDTTVATQVDINALIDQTILLVEPDARMQNIEISKTVQKLPMIQADRVQIAQVLVNLLRNSLDAITAFDPVERRVVVSGKFVDDQVVVSVEDSGPGVDSGIKLFEPFETGKNEGMGLGLSISKSIIEAHDGTMWSSKGDKLSGASFTIALPMKAETSR